MIINSKILLLLFIIFINNFGGTNGTGEENENDLLFEEMWRKAFELNPQNLAQLNSDQKKEEKQKEVKIEKEEDDDQKVGKSENKSLGKIKMEPIFDQTEGKDSDQKNCKKIKKEAKIEENADHNNQTESEKKKLEIVNEFNKMRNDYILKNKYKREERNKIEVNFANKLGTKRYIIYRWKKELCQKMKKEFKEEKLEIIKKFNQIRKEYKLKNNCKNEDKYEIERDIANELGTYRAKIYKWKREFYKKDEVPAIENVVKISLIKKFDKMKKEYKIKNNCKNEDRQKIETEIARALGTSRAKIYKWKRELNRQKEKEDKERNKVPTKKGNAFKMSLIKKFDKKRNDYKMNNNYKSENRHKIEREIAKALGTFRYKIYKWKKELWHKKEKETEKTNEIASEWMALSKWRYTKEQKREIIEHFDKLREEFSSKFNAKMSKEIQKKIARKLGVCLNTIYKWRGIFKKTVSNIL